MRKAGALAILALALSACSGSGTRAAGKRMIVLGIDGMDPRFLEAHWSSLPNLNRLRTEGDFKRLTTTIPPQSPVAWSSVTTGMDPGGHGIFDFVHRNPATRMPMSSMAEATESAHTLDIGPYVLPLSSGHVSTMRAGHAFWQTLGEHGVSATVIRMPANFPAVDCEQESLSGMGTPDLRGTARTYTFFTDDPTEIRKEVSGGEIVKVKLQDGRALLRVDGPPNTLRKDRAVTSVTMTVDVDPTENVARVELNGQPAVLRQGEWSEWFHASFPLIAGVKSASGIFRVYLQQAHPHLRFYVSPVNIDPADPALPISTPATFSRKLNDAVGPFYTEGIAEETGAYRAGLFTRAEFLVQSRKVLSDSMRLFRRELDRFQDGLLFYYFSSVDQNAHMLWGRYDDDLLEVYKAIDVAVGEAMQKAGRDTKLVILSDHGFARFDRAVHINSFLMQNGFLVLDDPKNVGDQELFAHVDWGRTVAYAVGLNGLYLNQEGREDGGIVPVADRQLILARIAARLKEFKDPANGENVVDTVYFAETAFQGKNLKYAPDILVGFRRGYRASWQTALGAVPKDTVEDNTQAWIGDHCMAHQLVPGVLLSNRKITAAEPRLVDIATTILGEFSIANGPGMIGRSVFLGRAMELFNAAIDGLLKLYFAAFSWAPPMAGLAVLSAIAGAAMLWVFGKTSDQKRMKQVKRKVYASLLELRVFSDEPAVSWRAQKSLVGANLRYMGLALMPALWMAAPMVLLIIHLESFYARAPLAVGREAIVTMGMAPGWDARSPAPAVTAPAGVEIAGPPVRVESAREISWRIVPRAEVSGQLVFRVGGTEVARGIEAGRRQRYVAGRSVRSTIASLWEPAQPRIASDAVEWIDVDYPEAVPGMFGVRLNWLVWFFAISIVAALVLKKRFGIVI